MTEVNKRRKWDRRSHLDKCRRDQAVQTHTDEQGKEQQFFIKPHSKEDEKKHRDTSGSSSSSRPHRNNDRDNTLPTLKAASSVHECSQITPLVFRKTNSKTTDTQHHQTNVKKIFIAFTWSFIFQQECIGESFVREAGTSLSFSLSLFLVSTHTNKALLERLHVPCVNPVGDDVLLKAEMAQQQCRSRTNTSPKWWRTHPATVVKCPTFTFPLYTHRNTSLGHYLSGLLQALKATHNTTSSSWLQSAGMIW